MCSNRRSERNRMPQSSGICSGRKQMEDATEPTGTQVPQGYGPLIAPMSESMRPLRQQIFERVRAAGAISRAQVAKDLGISHASVTTLTSELIDAGLLHVLDLRLAAARERAAAIAVTPTTLDFGETSESLQIEIAAALVH